RQPPRRGARDYREGHAAWRVRRLEAAVLNGVCASSVSQGSHRGRVYFAAMSTRTKTFLSALLLLALATLSSAMAQVTRAVVSPFDADATSQAYQLGLASAVQRS